MATTIRFTDTELENATDFAARRAVDQPDNRGISQSREEHKRNLRVGRLGKIAFAKYLQSQGKDHLDMQNWKDMYSADQMDFPTQTGATIDVKTASERYHTRILVPEDEYRDNPKDYYVGARIDNDIARIRGYALWEEFDSFDGARYPAYAVNLKDLNPIDELLSEF